MTDLILPALTLAAVGAFAGVLAGLLGVGGGIVLVPAFLYLFSTSGYGSDDLMQICLATSRAAVDADVPGHLACDDHRHFGTVGHGP